MSVAAPATAHAAVGLPPGPLRWTYGVTTQPRRARGDAPATTAVRPAAPHPDPTR